MPDIVCAIRGGPGSYHTRLAALRHASHHAVTVHFVSVVDPVAYGPLHEGEQHAIRAEMSWRDLAMARATAARAGLDEVRFTVAVRVGDLAATITAYAEEVGADSILIGRPRSADDALLAGAGAEQFAAELRRRSNVTVTVVDPERQQA
jgi:nucleotide-binding universal stress UspA family protein